MDLSHVHFHGVPTSRIRAAHRADNPGLVRSLPAIDARAGQDAAPASPHGLLAYVLAHAGLHPAAYRARALERRLGACVRAVRAGSEIHARRRLESSPDLHAAALSAVLIGVSGFFRDAAVFDTIRGVVIPAMRERPRPIRIWSVGCSTGAELYSIAMLLADAGALRRAFLVGTDCRADALDGARGGMFTDEALAGVDPAHQSRYFERAGRRWRVVESLRAHTAWRLSDATREIQEGPWDLVLCRNLAIYLQAPASEAMFRRIADQLSPGGFLVVGKAERPSAALPLESAGRCIYRRHEH